MELVGTLTNLGWLALKILLVWLGCSLAALPLMLWWQRRRDVCLAPGPTEIPRFVKKAFFAKPWHHRIGPYHQLEKSAREMMKILFGAFDGEVLFFSAAGTNMMTEVARNLIRPGDRVLVINTGYFGERWEAMARDMGAVIRMCHGKDGNTYSRETVEYELLTFRPRLVLMQKTDTATGVWNDTAFVGKIIREYNLPTILAVDAVLEAGVSEINMLADGIDILIGASQKAFMLPPGMGFVVVRPRARAAAQYREWPACAGDFIAHIKAVENDSLLFTPPTHHIAALHIVLKKMFQDLPGWYGETAQRACRFREKMFALGFTMYTKGPTSNGLSVLKIPPGWNAQEFQAYMEERGFYVAAGINSDTTKSVIRVAHLLGIRWRDLQRFVRETRYYKKLKDRTAPS